MHVAELRQRHGGQRARVRVGRTGAHQNTLWHVDGTRLGVRVHRRRRAHLRPKESSRRLSPRRASRAKPTYVPTTHYTRRTTSPVAAMHLLRPYRWHMPATGGNSTRLPAPAWVADQSGLNFACARHSQLPWHRPPSKGSRCRPVSADAGWHHESISHTKGPTCTAAHTGDSTE